MFKSARLISTLRLVLMGYRESLYVYSSTQPPDPILAQIQETPMGAVVREVDQQVRVRVWSPVQVQLERDMQEFFK